MKTHKELTMSAHHKKPRSAGISVLIYERPLHPELVSAHIRRTRLVGEFDVNIWLLNNGGHLLAITGPQTICELCCFPSKTLPDRGLLQRIPCKGDKLYDVAMGDSHHYYLAINEEHVTDTLYENSVAELLRIAEEQAGVVAQRKNELDETEGLSVVVTQLHRRAVHIESFHLLRHAHVLVRTQSVIEPSR
ncbi:MAG: hypothetical protein M1472_01835 [Planctomycetes bacterium]|jgi:hypothetical protein|nr:hypothetical protein [Planctomycetota bacterium]MDA8377058.1 hypothetical protein [Planctomycetia bacterium]